MRAYKTGPTALASYTRKKESKKNNINVYTLTCDVHSLAPSHACVGMGVGVA